MLRFNYAHCVSALNRESTSKQKERIQCWWWSVASSSFSVSLHLNQFDFSAAHRWCAKVQNFCACLYARAFFSCSKNAMHLSIFHCSCLLWLRACTGIRSKEFVWLRADQPYTPMEKAHWSKIHTNKYEHGEARRTYVVCHTVRYWRHHNFLWFHTMMHASFTLSVYV